jgi:Na+-transporting NADH:ubiquinone oxidoreductase subunit C
MQKDSPLKIIIIALILCVVCSVMVSSAAVLLKDRQQANKVLDIKKNLLVASGLLTKEEATPENIQKEYQRVEAKVIDLSTGEVAPGIDPETFDQRKARKDPDRNKIIKPENDLADIKMRSQYAPVYEIKEDGRVSMIVLPVNGKGLWSTLYGFVAMSADLSEIKGIGFYEHAETPGLGGEIENPKWQAQWAGKKAFDDQGRVIFQVTKGSVNPEASNADYMVDGLSGATITSNGVTNLVRYWLGEHGFGPYLQKQMKAQAM